MTAEWLFKCARVLQRYFTGVIWGFSLAMILTMFVVVWHPVLRAWLNGHDVVQGVVRVSTPTSTTVEAGGEIHVLSNLKYEMTPGELVVLELGSVNTSRLLQVPAGFLAFSASVAIAAVIAGVWTAWILAFYLASCAMLRAQEQVYMSLKAGGLGGTPAEILQEFPIDKEAERKLQRVTLPWLMGWTGYIFLSAGLFIGAAALMTTHYWYLGFAFIVITVILYFAISRISKYLVNRCPRCVANTSLLHEEKSLITWAICPHCRIRMKTAPPPDNT